MIPDLRRIGRYELDEMELIGNNMFTVGVPSESDAEFKAYIMAAGTAYAWGQKSIDNVLRRHGERWVENFDTAVERSNTRSA